MRVLFNLKSVRVLAFVAAVILAPVAGSAQSSVAVADAEKFMGTWVLSFESPMGPLQVTFAVTDAAGKVAAKMDAAEFSASPIADISKEGESLASRFTIDVQGMTVPCKLTVTLDGDKLKATFDFADGQFSMPGTGTKK